MPSIHQLSASVINQIAAGEVVERPASVVKELMENAIDACARRIDVTVGQGGMELVRVVDDGCGIDAEQLALAVAPHATSKICQADDLFRVATLGFRGEALASIAEVSRFVLRSRPESQQAGAELELTGGRQSPISPCGCPVGTQIEVHNLFYNTPVRRKFLRTMQTEMGYTSEAFTRLALAHPTRHFALRQQDKLVYDLPPADDWLDRIAALFGSSLAEQLMWIESSDGEVRLSGYVANPTQSRGNQKMQYLFLNGRAIRDRALQHALGEAYRGLLLTGRHPIAVLQIEMPPELVDVNVHPTKLEVRFQDGGRLYSQLLGTLRTRFLTTDLTAKFRPGGAGGGIDRNAIADGDGLLPSSAAAPIDPTGGHDAQRAAQMREELVRWAKGELAAIGGAGTQTETVSLDSAAGSVAGNAYKGGSHGGRPFGPSAGGRDFGPMVRMPSPSSQALELVPLDRARFGLPGAPSTAMPTADRPLAPVRQPSPAIQVHDRYLIAETDDGMVVIDQHALHERVLYEQVREKVLAGALETQRLLVPEPVDLSPAETAAALANRELLAQLGIEVESFGGGTLLVGSYPAMLVKLRPADMLRTLVERLVDGGKAPDRRDLLDDLLHMIACKAAIKAGDRLTPEEVAELVEQRHLAQDAHHCPHGRPTALVFTRDDLDRQFKRT
ncbi:MAG TPA: DNA mismatch repair endonuclease MutL [Pirellulales bacterium]|jgi:DNA mismatch repair protein MutL|nr:DNA mismatch repair endonuclease MutL [Pirellulales bacterium]